MITSRASRARKMSSTPWSRVVRSPLAFSSLLFFIVMILMFGRLIGEVVVDQSCNHGVFDYDLRTQAKLSSIVHEPWMFAVSVRDSIRVVGWDWQRPIRHYGGLARWLSRARVRGRIRYACSSDEKAVEELHGRFAFSSYPKSK